MQNDTFAQYAPLIARILLSAIFIMSAFGKIMDPAGTQGYMDAFGLPIIGILFVLAIIIEGLGGLSLLLGFKARWGAFVLIGFTLVATFTFHLNLADQTQMVMFLKNAAIIGGLLLVALHGAGPLSFDHKKESSTV